MIKDKINFKSLGNYSVLKEVENIEEFLNIINSEEYEIIYNIYSYNSSDTTKADGLYFNNSKGKRYFCTKCKTIGPSKTTNYSSFVTCPNCKEGHLINLNYDESEKPSFIHYNKDTNRIETIIVSMDNDVVEVNGVKEEDRGKVIINIETLDTLYYDDDNKLVFKRNDKIYRSCDLSKCFLKYFIPNNEHLKDLSLIDDSYTLKLNAIYLANLIDLDRIDLKSWFENDFYKNLLELIFKHLNHDFYNLDERYKEKHFIDTDWKTPEDFLKEFDDRFIDIAFKRHLNSYNMSDWGLDRLSDFFNKYRKVYSNIVFLDDIDPNYIENIEAIVENNLDEDRFIRFLDEYVENIKKVSQITNFSIKSSSDLIFDYLKNNVYNYNLNYGNNNYNGVFGSLINKIKFLLSHNVEVNKTNLNNRQFNRLVNLMNMNKDYKLPKEKAEAFHLIIDNDPLLAYSFLSNRRQLNKDEIKILKNYTEKKGD